MRLQTTIIKIGTNGERTAAAAEPAQATAALAVAADVNGDVPAVKVRAAAAKALRNHLK